MYPKLGVNIDHVATIRNSRGTTYPDPLYAAVLAELGGADQITIHLREDRRHIIDRDLQLLRQTVKTRLNLEMAVTDEMIAIAKKNRPDMTTLVPEKREEKTTEGGLDLKKDSDKTIKTINELKEADITVSLFIDPDLDQVHLAREFGAHAIEIHTGTYANEVTPEGLNREFDKIKESANNGNNIGLKVYAGHGLHLQNIQPLLSIPVIREYNIGHAIIGQALMIGIEKAVREMKECIYRFYPSDK